MPKLLTVQVIAVERHAGSGTEADPHRLVQAWYSVDGELLLELDGGGQTFAAINMARFLAAAECRPHEFDHTVPGAPCCRKCGLPFRGRLRA